MARTNNLTNFLNDVATAIKTKLGDNTPIPASQFDTKIGQIETGGTYQSKTVNVVTNGSQTITPDTGYDALSSVLINVQVPIPSLQTKNYEFTQNTHIVLSPEQGYDGFSSIDLTINVPTIDTSDATATVNDIVENKTAYVNGQKITGTISERRNTQYLIPIGRDTTVQNSPKAQSVVATSKVVDNGSSYVIDRTNKAQIRMPYADVASAISLTAEKIVSGNTILGIEGTGGSTINNQDKTITQNGTYTADSGYTGLGEVTVNVPGQDLSDATATAQEILNGKTAYISTGKVTGSMEAARHFRNKQAMITYEANNNCNMGDLAIIYDLVQTNWSGEGILNIVTFPQQVVLPEAFTGNAYIYGRTEENYWDIDGSISSTNMSLTIYGTDSYRITYTSEDGITYNRTDSYSSSIDFGGQTTHMYEYNDIFGNFFKIIGGSFNGLYEYNTNTEYNACFLFDNMDMVHDDINWWIVQLPYLKYAFNNDGGSSGFYNELIITRYTTRLYQGVTIVEPIEYYGYNTTIMNPGIRIDKTTHKLCTYGNNKAYLDKYVNGEYVETISYESGEPTMTNLDLLNTIIVSHKSPFTNENSMAFVDFPNTTSSTRTLNFSLENVPTVNEFIPAQTQFTLSEANELLPKLVALGKNGEVVGSTSVYDNIPAEEMFKRTFNLPLQANDVDRYRLYAKSDKINIISSHRSDTPVYLVQTTMDDTNTDYSIGIAEYMYRVDDLTNLYGETIKNAYMNKFSNYFVCMITLANNEIHIIKVNELFTEVISDITAPTGTTSRNTYSCGNMCIMYFYNGTSYTNYIVKSDGSIIPINISTQIQKAVSTDDGYMAFMEASGKIYVFNPTNDTLYNIYTETGGKTFISLGVFNFSDKLYVGISYRTGSYSSYTYTRLCYLYNKSTKSYSSVISGTTSKYVGFYSDGIARQTCIITNNVLYDYGAGYFCRLTNIGTVYASSLNIYVNSTSSKTWIRGAIDNTTVGIYDTAIYKLVNYSTISNITSITDVKLDDDYTRYCVLHCTLTPIVRGLDKRGISSIITKDYDEDTGEYVNNIFEFNFTGASKINTIDTFSYNGYSMAVKFKYYNFKLAGNNVPDFMLIKTGFIKQNYSSEPSTDLLYLNPSAVLSTN